MERNMKTDKTHIAIVLDCSGSMSSIKSDMEGAIETFIQDQKLLPGDVAFEVTRFSTGVYDTIVFDDKPIEMHCNGYTALNDAVGTVIDNLGQKLASLPESERPGKVIVCIITDGFENASKNYHHEQVASMIKHQTEVYKWDFIYLGANQDAFTVGQSYNIKTNVSYTATAAGTQDMSRSLRSQVSVWRQ